MSGGYPLIPHFDPATFKGDRLDAGLTKAALARAAGVGESTVGGWELGERWPSYAFWKRVSLVLLAAEESSPPDWLWRRHAPAWDLDHADDWPEIPEGWEPS